MISESKRGKKIHYLQCDLLLPNWIKNSLKRVHMNPTSRKRKSSSDIKGAVSRYLDKKLEGVFASIEFQNECSSFVVKDYLKVLKLFPVACRCG